MKDIRNERTSNTSAFVKFKTKGVFSSTISLKRESQSALHIFVLCFDMQIVETQDKNLSKQSNFIQMLQNVLVGTKGAVVETKVLGTLSFVTTQISSFVTTNTVYLRIPISKFSNEIVSLFTHLTVPVGTISQFVHHLAQSHSVETREKLTAPVETRKKITAPVETRKR